MNRKEDKRISFLICFVAALAVGGRQYYKFADKHGFFYQISPEWGGLIIFGSIASILGVFALLIFREGTGKE